MQQHMLKHKKNAIGFQLICADKFYLHPYFIIASAARFEKQLILNLNGSLYGAADRTLSHDPHWHRSLTRTSRPLPPASHATALVAGDGVEI